MLLLRDAHPSQIAPLVWTMLKKQTIWLGRASLISTSLRGNKHYSCPHKEGALIQPILNGNSPQSWPTGLEGNLLCRKEKSFKSRFQINFLNWRMSQKFFSLGLGGNVKMQWTFPCSTAFEGVFLYFRGAINTTNLIWLDCISNFLVYRQFGNISERNPSSALAGSISAKAIYELDRVIAVTPVTKCWHYQSCEQVVAEILKWEIHLHHL